MRKLPAVETLGTRASSFRHLRRRANLERLLAEFGGSRALAAIVDTPDAHISALRAGKRGIGDVLAAKLERRCEKPVGWMDQEHEPLGPVPPGHQPERSLELDVLRALRELPSEQRLRVAADVVAQAARHRYMAQAQRRASEAASDGAATDASPTSLIDGHGVTATSRHGDALVLGADDFTRTS